MNCRIEKFGGRKLPRLRTNTKSLCIKTIEDELKIRECVEILQISKYRGEEFKLPNNIKLLIVKTHYEYVGTLMSMIKNANVINLYLNVSCYKCNDSTIINICELLPSIKKF